MNTSSQTKIVVLLSLGIAACIALLPWSRWLSGPVDYEGRLTERVAEYVRLRKADDWQNIYAMMDPADRRAVPIARFLMLYGTGSLRTHDITEKERVIDEGAGTASTMLTLDGELRIDRLPASVRRSLRDTSETRQKADFPLSWSWVDGDWWTRMDQQAITGRSADGRPITASTEAPPK